MRYPSVCFYMFYFDIYFLSQGMVLQSNEFDEGIGGDTDSLGEGSWENKKLNSRSFRTLIEVLRFCDARLLRKNIECQGNHYANVTRALYLEASELKAFLGHVLHDLDSPQNSPKEDQNTSLSTDIQSTTSNKASTADFNTRKYVKDWARLWVEVMVELRQKTKENRAQQYNSDEAAECIVPETESYKCTPFTRENLNNTEELEAMRKSTRSLDTLDSLPSDAESRIFNFLKSRVSSHEELSSTPRCMSSDSIDVLTDDDELDTEGTQQKGQKKLVVHQKLVRKISDWDQYSIDDTLEQDFLDGSYEDDYDLDSNQEKMNNNKNNTQHNNSNIPVSNGRSIVEYDVFADSMSSLRRNTAPSTLSNQMKRKGFSKSEMCLHQINIDENHSDFTDNGQSTPDELLCKIGASLTEIFKIRQELTRAELQMSRDVDLQKLKKCFGCKKNKFNIFQRPRVCAVCKKKYCVLCIIENVPIPPSLTETLPPNVDIEYNANQNNSSNLVRSKSMLNVGPSTTVKQLPWQRNAKVKGVRLSMCHDCHSFVDSIKTERAKIEWKVQLELDL